MAQSEYNVVIEIDSKSGFCFGVSRAVRMAEEILDKNETLASLGDIVHNNEEVLRLEHKGLITASHEQLSNLHNRTVLLRAHGEPPATYDLLKKQGIKIIDATCPVVLKLQHNVREAWAELKKKNGQIVIYGKKGHPEVVGLIGQTNGEAIVISGVEDIKFLDSSRPIELFSQTTMSNSGLTDIENGIRLRFGNNIDFKVHHSICAQVENRAPHLKEFAGKYDVVIFVGGEKSSNGKMLFDVCKQVNEHTFYAHSENAVNKQWFDSNPKSIGICGATSTPHWLMEKVAGKVKELF